MRYDTLFKWSFTFDYLEPVLNGSTVTYQFVRSDVAKVNNSAADVLYLITQEPLQVGGKVGNLRDANGTDILLIGGNPYELYVQSSQPLFGVFDTLTGWKHALKRTAPRDFQQALLDIATSAV